jgi:hypothetical protein
MPDVSVSFLRNLFAEAAPASPALDKITNNDLFMEAAAAVQNHPEAFSAFANGVYVASWSAQLAATGGAGPTASGTHTAKFNYTIGTQVGKLSFDSFFEVIDGAPGQGSGKPIPAADPSLTSWDSAANGNDGLIAFQNALQTLLSQTEVSPNTETILAQSHVTFTPWNIGFLIQGPQMPGSGGPVTITAPDEPRLTDAIDGTSVSVVVQGPSSPHAAPVLSGKSHPPFAKMHAAVHVTAQDRKDTAALLIPVPSGSTARHTPRTPEPARIADRADSGHLMRPNRKNIPQPMPSRLDALV